MRNKRRDKKRDKAFRDYLDDLCNSCHRVWTDCRILRGIIIVNRGPIVVKCNKYACVTMPKPLKELSREYMI